MDEVPQGKHYQQQPQAEAGKTIDYPYFFIPECCQDKQAEENAEK